MRIQAAVNQSSIRSRVVIVAVVIGLGTLAVAARLFQLQVVDSESLRAQATTPAPASHRDRWTPRLDRRPGGT